MKEIPVSEVTAVKIGQVENREAGTGCTMILAEEGMRAGIDIRGGGPASRDADLLNPLMNAGIIHGILLSGGSAFGLSAASGAQKYLESCGIGYDVGITRVPLVVQSGLFDLAVGESSIRPDEAMGYEAARTARETPNYRDGNYGAGCGCTVGKFLGPDYSMKSGVGSFAVQIGKVKIGAIVALNAYGDIFEWKSGRQIAGCLKEDGKSFLNTSEAMRGGMHKVANRFTGHTTLGVILTNAFFEKTALCKIAGMGHDGYARSIRPVHTSADGDSIYAVSAGREEADMDTVGAVGAEVISEAITRAVLSAESAYGRISAGELTP